MIGVNTIMSNKNHYDKIRKTFEQLRALKEACEDVMAQCINELNKEPIDVHKTIEEIRQERTEIEYLQKPTHKIHFRNRLSPEQELFHLKEQLSKILQDKNIDK